jgi:hypothetical protein
MLDLVETAIYDKLQSIGYDNRSDEQYVKRVKSEKPSPKSYSRKTKIARFDGSLSQNQRATVLHDFNQDPNTRVLLITLKYISLLFMFSISSIIQSYVLYYYDRAGGVGLNLTAASVVILIDPWYMTHITLLQL